MSLAKRCTRKRVICRFVENNKTVFVINFRKLHQAAMIQPIQSFTSLTLP
jgi:hypothetical protein